MARNFFSSIVHIKLSWRFCALVDATTYAYNINQVTNIFPILIDTLLYIISTTQDGKQFGIVSKKQDHNHYPFSLYNEISYEMLEDYFKNRSTRPKSSRFQIRLREKDQIKLFKLYNEFYPVPYTASNNVVADLMQIYVQTSLVLHFYLLVALALNHSLGFDTNKEKIKLKLWPMPSDLLHIEFLSTKI